MTNKLKSYSVTPASNNAASPDGWPEGMAPSGLNNSDREFAARVREWYNDPSWIDYGDTINSSTSTTVSIAGDVTAQYVVGRAVRAGQSDSAIGYVTASTYSAPNSSITCAGLDLTAVAQIELGAVKAGSQLPNGVVLSLGASSTAATASTGDSTTKVATTAFVQQEIAAALPAVRSHVRAVQTTPQSIASASWTVVAYAVEQYDTNSNYDNATYTFTANTATAGYYSVSARLEMDAATLSVDEGMVVAVYKGASNVASGMREWTDNGRSRKSASTVNTTINLAAGETVTIRAYQDQGAAVNTTATADTCYVTMDRLL